MKNALGEALYVIAISICITVKVNTKTEVIRTDLVTIEFVANMFITELLNIQF